MATRRLEVDFIFDDKQATRAFGRTGRNVSLLEKRFGRMGLVASRSLNAAATSVQRLGSAARTASPYITTGLVLGLGKSVAEAREASKAMAQTEAVIKSTGGSANVTARDIDRLTGRLSEKVAVDDEAIQSGANLLLTFKNIRNETGAGNKIFDQSTRTILDMSAALDQDLKASAIQVGKALNDPTVGLTALSRVGVTFTAQEKEKITALQESGDQLKAQKLILAELSSEFKGSAQANADSYDRLTVIFENLAESVGKKVSPALEDMADKVGSILSDKKLTGDQKASALADYFEELVGKGIDKLSDLAPDFAEAGAKISGRLLVGFGRAFMDSDWLGKLFLGGLFIRAVGGRGALATVGRKMATWIAAPMATTIAAQSAAGATKGAAAGSWRAMGRSIGRFVGPLAAAYLAIELWPAIDKAFRGGPTLDKMVSRQDKIVEDFSAYTDKLIKQNDRMHDTTERRTKQSGERQKRTFEETRGKLAEITAKQTGDVAGNVGNMVNKVGDGLKTLGSNTNKALQAFGAKKVSFAVESVGDTAKTLFKQRGGPINVGAPSGDSVPAMLEKGEYVLNRNAVSKVGKGNLDALNFGAAKRFQQGGSVVEALGPYDISPFQYDSNHAGGNSHWHIAMSTPSAVVSLGKKLQQMGFMVGEHPAFGGVGGMHAPGGYHYSNQAIDVNSAANETRAETASIARLLNTGVFKGAIATQLKRLLLNGPDGPLKTMGQGALDKARKAAQSFINSKRPVEGPEAGLLSGSGDVEATFAKVAKQLSNHRNATMALGMAGYAESGMRDLSYGHSSSQGALQLLSSTASGMGISPHDEKAIASAFLLRGFYGRGGANALAASGLPAHLVAQGVQGSAFSSGSNYLAQAGNARAWMNRYGLQKGGMPTLDVGGRVTKEGLAQVHPGDVHMGKGGPTVIIKGDVIPHPGVGPDEVVEIIWGEAGELADFTLRSGGRSRGRSRQLARG